MKITLLGTGTPIPDPNRAGPAQLVQSGEASVLVDAGRGVVQRLVGAGVMPAFLSGVLITHLHSDHVSDLNDVITTTWVMAGDFMDLKVFGPEGTAQLVERAIAMLEADISYRTTHHEDLTKGPKVTVTEVEPGQRFELAGLGVTVGATDHRPVSPTVAFRIDDGERSVVMAGDGVPCETLDDLCRGASAYCQAVIRDDLVKAIPIQRIQDILDYHSSVEQAAETAARAGVGTLILTHYVPGPPVGEEEAFVVGAAQHFQGRIACGPDLTVVEL